jgi:very-short-patch-repair endonuclease
MGWEEMMIAVEYDGDQHRSDRAQYAWDVKRIGMINDRGWIHIRVIAEHRPAEIIERVRRAWAQREAEGRVAKRRV